MSEKKVVVTFKATTRYDFEDDKGKRVYGTNVWLEELKPLDNEDAKGFVPRKISFANKLEMYDKMIKIPANTQVEVVEETSFGSRGMITKIVDFIPVKEQLKM